MQSRRIQLKNHRRTVVLGALLALTGCGAEGNESTQDLGQDSQALQTDAAAAARKPELPEPAALRAHPGLEISRTDSFGMPTFVRGGRLGRVAIPEDPSSSAGQAQLRSSVAEAASIFGLSPEELSFSRTQVDELGNTHLRFSQTRRGLPVFGAELIVHLDKEGNIFAVNGNARGNQSGEDSPRVSAGSAVEAARAARKDAQVTSAQEQRLVYYRTGPSQVVLAYDVLVTGQRPDGTPVLDNVLVSAEDGSVLRIAPQVHGALNRSVYTANTAYSLPGTLVRSEGGAAVADAVVNTNYNHLGTTYNCYKNLFNRDSYDNAGAGLKSTVHYGVKYVNAFWNGTQMVYGDGNGTTAINLALSLDVTAHELTHAVTGSSSKLIYSGESGGLNESMSDIFGNVCEWYGDGKVVSADTWLVGEDVWTPATTGDALRYMNNPHQDGTSLDYYPDYAAVVAGGGSVGVHYSSGISNLAFYLLAQGGTHPASKTSNFVSGIGVDKAAQIFYYANAYLLVPDSTFLDARAMTEEAAMILGYGATVKASVASAWLAVGVDAPQLTNLVAVNSLSGDAGSEQYFKFVVPYGVNNITFTTSGGTGDVDLYVKASNIPSPYAFDCRPYVVGNNETCFFAKPTASVYYVTLRGWSAYSGVSLKASYDLRPGIAVTALADGAGGEKYFKLNVPAGASELRFNITGSVGDADLYVKRGAIPTSAVFDCRPYISGSNESCSFAAPVAGTYYVMVKGFGAYSGVSVAASYVTQVVGNGSVVSSITDTSPGQKFYKINVPAGATNLTVSISGTIGDADLYLKSGVLPTLSTFDCRPYINGSNENCTIPAPTAGAYYIMLRGFVDYSGVTLTTSYTL